MYAEVERDMQTEMGISREDFAQMYVFVFVHACVSVIVVLGFTVDDVAPALPYT